MNWKAEKVIVQLEEFKPVILPENIFIQMDKFVSAKIQIYQFF
jgi:hypothetical protein